MSTYRIRIIAPVATGAFNEPIRQAVAPVVPPDVVVDVRNLAAGRDCIQDRRDLAENAPHVVALARRSEQEGCHGIFVTDFDMCGVEPAREVVSIPVLGGFTPCAFAAMALAQRFSIITVLQSTLAMQAGHVRAYGLGESFASIRAIDCPVHELADRAKVVRRVLREGLAAVREDGAQALLLGCTGFIGIADEVSRRLERELGAYVPVIDPNQASFGYLVMLVRCGLRQSRLCYAAAPEERTRARSMHGGGRQARARPTDAARG
jgi:Asp/Glu/hydantoin racemase